jgi:hypothetical protein
MNSVLLEPRNFLGQRHISVSPGPPPVIVARTTTGVPLFDLDTATQLTALGNMKAFAEKPMASGPGRGF